MEWLAIIYAILAFIIIVMVLSGYGKAIDSKINKIKHIEGHSNESGTEKELEGTFVNRVLKPKLKFLSKPSNQVTDSNARRNDKMKEVSRKIRLAGLHIDAESFVFYKQAIMILCIVVSLFILVVTGQFLIFLLGVGIGLLGPNMFLKSKVKSYQEAIRNQLPDGLDLLGVCIEAGLSFDASLAKVAERMKGPFIDQLVLVYSQMQMGVSRADALRNLSNSTEIPELKTFVAALAQANQLGIPINNVMKVQSEQIRETRRQMAKEKGQKAPIKIMLPMVLLILPVLFIILMGPTVMNIAEMFM